MKAENEDLNWNAKMNHKNGNRNRLDKELTARMFTAEGD